MMNRETESSRLSELRARTDRQLATFITHRLDIGLRLAASDGDRAEAERSYAEVSALIGWVEGLSAVERRSMESKLDRLRDVLNDLSSDAELKVLTAFS